MDSQQVDCNNVQTAPMYKSVHGRLSEWSKRRQLERNQVLANQEDRKQESAESKHSTGTQSNPSYDLPPVMEGLKTQGTYTATNERNIPVPTRREIFRLDKHNQESSEDDNRRVPRSHLTTQGVRNDREKELQKNESKGSSSDSDY